MSLEPVSRRRDLLRKDAAEERAWESSLDAYFSKQGENLFSDLPWGCIKMKVSREIISSIS